MIIILKEYKLDIVLFTKRDFLSPCPIIVTYLLIILHVEAKTKILILYYIDFFASY